MALDKDSLTTAMIEAVKSCPDGGDEAMARLGKAVEDYLVANTVAVYAWVAVDPKGSPDSTTAFTAVLSASGTTFECKPKDFDDFIARLAEWLNGIKINAPSGFSVSPLMTTAGTFTAEQLGSFADKTDCEGAMKDAFGKIAEGCIAGWKSTYIMTAGSGSHSAFTGSATLSSVA